MDRSFPAIGSVVIVVALLAQVLGTGVARADANREAVIDMTFPVPGPVSYTDNYLANRDGGRRKHQATDIMAAKGQAVHAAVGGRVCFAPGIDGPMPAYGYMVRVCTGTIVYSYIHLDNDTPGTDDGLGGPGGAYAPGIREGVQVQRGQLLGWLGDSGNAEDTPPHLHFDIFDTDLVDPALAAAPWRQHYRNPYPSLRAASAVGDVASSALRLGARGPEVSDWQARLNRAVDPDVTVDGAFGPATDAATRGFQRAHGLTDDGVVGPATLAAMDAAAPTGAATPGATATGSTSDGAGYGGRPLSLTDPRMRGEDVRAWQSRMRDRGWRGADGRPLAVDGIFGADSARAARLFQEEKGLAADAVVGPATWAATFATG